MPLKVFVVFHEKLLPGCYAGLSQEEFDLLTFVAVNPEVPKSYDANVFKNVINEWELPEYDPSLQALGYCENSVIWHACKNALFSPDDCVLFLQWDMVLQAGSILAIREGSEKAPMWLAPTEWRRMAECFRDLDLLADICNSFQETFQTPLKFGTAFYPLANAYAVLGRDMAVMAEWAFSLRDTVEEKCKDAAAWEHLAAEKHIGIVYEHIFALAFANLYGSWDFITGVWHPTTHAIEDAPEEVIDAMGTTLNFKNRLTTRTAPEFQEIETS